MSRRRSKQASRPSTRWPKTSSRGRVLMIFVDGVGLAPAGSDNPLPVAHCRFDHLLGGPLTIDAVQRRPRTEPDGRRRLPGCRGSTAERHRSDDPVHGVNAARELGRHVTASRALVSRRSSRVTAVFKRLVVAGTSVTFANFFTRRYEQLLQRRRFAAAPPPCGAGGRLSPARHQRSPVWARGELGHGARFTSRVRRRKRSRR